MNIAEEFPLLSFLPFREGKPSNFQLAIAVRTAETGSVEEKPICTHSLHEVDSFVAEVAEITGINALFVGNRLGLWNKDAKVGERE